MMHRFDALNQEMGFRAHCGYSRGRVPQCLEEQNPS